MKILAIVTSVRSYRNHDLPTGLWLGELTHMYDACMNLDIDLTIASPAGGDTPIDPESLKFFALDRISRTYYRDESFRDFLKTTLPLDQVGENEFDAVYLTGGHGTMYDFVGNGRLNDLVRAFFESDKIVSAVCHGVCGLIDVKLSNGDCLVKNRRVTGYSWFEEILARRNKQVPFNLQQVLHKRGADYVKSFVPFAPFVVSDGKLITGQNPFSSKRIAERVTAELTGSI